MKVFAIGWYISYYCSYLVFSEKCVSKYFKIHENHALSDSQPNETISEENRIACGIRCTNKDWCRGINFVPHAASQQCELFSAKQIQTGKIIKDEMSVYYQIMESEDGGSKTDNHVSVSPTKDIAFVSLTSLIPRPTAACKKIYQLNPNSPDGKHTVFKGTSNQAEVFCDMSGKFTGCKGGGWTLVMRTHGERDTFRYESNYWTNKNDYNPEYGVTLDSIHETKLSTYYTTPFTQICLGMKYNNVKGWTSFNLTGDSLFDLVSSNVYHAADNPIAEWKKLIPAGVALQDKCRLQGINVARGDTGVRIGIIATKTCGNAGHYNSRLGFGAKGISCGQDGTNKCGNEARCECRVRKQ